MSKKKCTLLIAAMAFSVTMLAACQGGNETRQKASEVAAPETPTPEPTSTPIPTPEPTSTPTPVPLKTIGVKAEGTYEIRLKNTTGKVIKGFAIKERDAEAFSSNLLENGDKIENN